MANATRDETRQVVMWLPNGMWLPLSQLYRDKEAAQRAIDADRARTGLPADRYQIVPAGDWRRG